MTDEKKTDRLGPPLDDPEATEPPTPAPASASRPEYANTVISKRGPAPGATAEERAAHERLLAERSSAERYAVPRDPSQIPTDPDRVAPTAQRPLILRQPLASRPLAAPVPQAPASASEVITDPMPQPDVLAAIAHSSRVAILPPAPLAPRVERTQVSHQMPAQVAAPQGPPAFARPAMRPQDVERPPEVAPPPTIAPAQLHQEVGSPTEAASAPSPVPVPRAAAVTAPVPAVVRAPPAVAEVAAPRPSREIERAAPKVPGTRPAPQIPYFGVPPSSRPAPPPVVAAKPRPAPAVAPPQSGPPWSSPAVTAPDPFPKFEPAPEDAGAEDTAEQPARKPSSDDLVASDQVLANPASLWRRALSWVFDFSVIAGTVSGLVSLALAVMKARPIPNNVHGIDVFLFRLHPIAIPALVLTVLVAGLYTALGAFLLEGRTLGRLMLGIRLVDSSGRAPSRIRSALRAAFAIVSFALFLAGFWLALFDRRGQTLHDKLTRTFVVRPV